MFIGLKLDMETIPNAEYMKTTMTTAKSTPQYALAKSHHSHRADSNLYAILGPGCFKWCGIILIYLLKTFKTFGSAGESSVYIYNMQHARSRQPRQTKGTGWGMLFLCSILCCYVSKKTGL